MPLMRGMPMLVALAALVTSGCGGGTQRTNVGRANQTSTAQTATTFAQNALLPTLSLGEERTFAPGALRPGEEVLCLANGLTVSARVPSAGELTATDSFSQSSGRVSIEITPRVDGSFAARCTS